LIGRHGDGADLGRQEERGAPPVYLGLNLPILPLVLTVLGAELIVRAAWRKDWHQAAWRTEWLLFGPEAVIAISWNAVLRRRIRR
jgi:hypothetical protein